MKSKIGIFRIVLLGIVSIYTNSCKEADSAIPENKENCKTSAVFNLSKTYGMVTDFDGNVYKTITIG